MVSHRGQENRLHFGLGLYVVRIIAEHHGGAVNALNLQDNTGVVFLVQLPLARSTNLEEQVYRTGTLPPR
jgi:K+-sensing histidine kinase KdpD